MYIFIIESIRSEYYNSILYLNVLFYAGNCEDDLNPVPLDCTQTGAPNCDTLVQQGHCDTSWASFPLCPTSTTGKVKDNCRNSCNLCYGRCIKPFPKIILCIFVE